MSRRTRRHGVLAVALLAGQIAASGDARAAMRHRAPAEADTTPLSLERPEPQFPVGAHWTLIAIAGTPAGSDPPSFTLDDKLRATGFSGCNSYSMTLYPIRGQRLAAGAVAMTRKPCDAATMRLERLFLTTLHSHPAWSIEGSDLLLKAGPVLMRFRRGV